MKLLAYINICCWLLVACNSQGQQHFNAGVVKNSFEIFSATATPPFLSSYLIWYRDSTAIMEIKTVRFDMKYGQPTVRKDTIMHYLYMDLRTMTFYQYGTFTDTAQLQISYWQPDSLYIDGGWNFYYNKNVVMTDKPEHLDDTSINNIDYKRIKFVSFEDKKLGTYTIGYIRCDRGRSIFSKEKIYSDSINCCLEKAEYFQNKTNIKGAMQGIEFVRDTLNTEEIKVFDTWERYAKQHPPKEKKLK
jgi:hypothetical protein